MNVARETHDSARPDPKFEGASHREMMKALLADPKPTQAPWWTRLLRVLSFASVLQTAVSTTPAENARILANLETPINFTNVRPALPTGPRVVVAPYTPHEWPAPV